MTTVDRFALNAILERILADGETFDPADAMALIQAVPLTKPGIPFRWKYSGTSRGRGVEGYASGLGNVSDDRERKVEKEGGFGSDALRVGGYKLIHRPGEILIELMWSDHRRLLDRGDGPSQSAVLRYNRLTKQPKDLRIERIVPFTLRWPFPRITFQFDLARFVPWKVPA